jgi:hypothetical protein
VGVLRDEVLSGVHTSSRAEESREPEGNSMRSAACGGQRRLRPITVALAALVAVVAFCIAAPVAMASPLGTARATGPAPDPKPPSPPPKPDPKPVAPSPAPTPPPPPPPPPPAPRFVAPPPAPTPVAPAPAPQPAPRAVVSRPKARVAPAAKRPAVKQQKRPASKRKATPVRAVKPAVPKRTRTIAAKSSPSLVQTAAPFGAGSSTGVAGARVALLLALFGLGFLILAAAAVPPTRVPWPVVAQPLLFHRFDLLLLGIGTIAIGIFCLGIAGLY